MQGEYIVDFAFDETVLLQPGYERAPAMRSGGNETVIVVQDTPTKIVLQHILVDGKSGHVTKHWRQDWIYEAPSRFEFSADQTWTVRAHSCRTRPQAPGRSACTKSATRRATAAPAAGLRQRHRHLDQRPDLASAAAPRVHQAQRLQRGLRDQPPYASRRAAGPTSSSTPRCCASPTARRWSWRASSASTITRRPTEVDFKPAYKYWDATQDYWAKVRTRWDAFLGKPPGVHLKTKIDGMAMIIPLFTQAGELEEGKQVADADDRQGVR